MNSKIIIAIILVLVVIVIVASGSLGNFEDDSENTSETIDDSSTGRMVTRGLSESVGIGIGP